MMNFIDVTTEHWGYESIQKAFDKGVMNGFEDGTFRPDEPMTRVQLCKVLDKLGVLD